MKASIFIIHRCALALCALAFFAPIAVFAQTTAFTYQGRLTDNSMAANAAYDMQFRLYDVAEAGQGTQQGTTVSKPNVQATNGLFTVQLDFGGGVFATGANLYLEISLRSAGSMGGYTSLAPRQPVTSTPYAIRALNVTNADNAITLNNVAASNYVQTNDPRLVNSRPPTSGSSNYIQNTNTPQASSNFNISGDGTAGGTLAANVVNAVTQYNLNGSRVLYSTGDNDNTFVGFNAGTNTTGQFNNFFGTNAGKDNTSGERNIFVGSYTGSHNTTGVENTFIGSVAGLDNTTGSKNVLIGSSVATNSVAANNNVIIGWNAGDSIDVSSNNTLIGSSADTASGIFTNATAIGANAIVGQSNSLVLGSIGTNVGIGTTTPAERLTVATATSKYGFIHTDGTITVGSFVGVGGSGTGGYLGTKSNHPLHLFTNSGAASLTITTGGLVQISNLGAAGSTQLCRNASNQIASCSSSLRYKTNIAAYGSGLNIVQRLRPITFNWKDGGMLDLGLGAEEVAAVEPLLVTHNASGQVEGVKYDRVAVILLNAVKEQQAQIAQQQSMIAALKQLACLDHPTAQVCK